jgi:dihydropteroate synthase
MNVELTSFDTPADARRALEGMGIEPEGARRLAMKAIMRPIVVRQVKGGAANLLKQELLARGGDAAVPSVAVMHPETLVDVCLLGTLQDYRSLLGWLRATPLFSLPVLADQLAELLAADLSAQ